MRRPRIAPIAALLLLGAMPAAATATSDSPAHPSCAEGPIRIGDTLVGTPCGDTILAPPGVETVKGGGGNDTIVPGPIAAEAECPNECRLGVGSQTFDGGPGNDTVFGERGNDTLNGGEGDDRLYGGIGDDTLHGGPGNDLLSGGHGFDYIDGEEGNDYVRGDGTIDRIFDTGGAADVDTLSYSTGVTPGFTRNDYPKFSPPPGFPESGERGVYLDLGEGVGDNGTAPFGGGVDEVEGQDFEKVIGTPFADFIVGTGKGETIYGSGGGDVILGEGGGDTVHDGGGARDPSKVTVGFAAPEETDYSQLYLVGSDASDSVTATYAAGAVTFELPAGTFGSPDGDCIATATKATCPLAVPLDSIVLAGLGGDDELETVGFPSTVSVMLLGGEGSDKLTGGEQTEDVLVDGPGTGADVLEALGRDDALMHNGGSDMRLGGEGNDLFLSNSICDGDALNGGPGRDNASWTKLKEPVEANLELGKAGSPGSGATPQCGSEALDKLEGIEDLEGTSEIKDVSSGADIFYGDEHANQLLGWSGADSYFAQAGDDSILANSGDTDLVIDCGEGNDSALIDESLDPSPVGCETVNGVGPSETLEEVLLPPSPPPDTSPPETKIRRRPLKLVRTSKVPRRVSFQFTSETDARFRCKLDGRGYAGCSSPRVYTVGRGKHVFRVLAVDAAGNRDPSPAIFRFRVKRVSAR